MTHAPALLGIQSGLFRKELAGVAELEVSSFNAGPSAVEALFSDAVDAAYIGPGPAINAHVRSRGEAARIVSGATEGGAALVVQPSVSTAADLRGKKLASPHLGNTQDIALRTWLKSKGMTSNLQGGGEVSVVPQENSQTLDTFRLGEIAGAWLPEPWASRLVEEAGAKVLVDESSLWPGGRFPTTVLVVRTEFLRSRPRVVEHLLRANLQSIESLNSRRDESLTQVNKLLAKELGKPLPANILNHASQKLVFTSEVLPATFRKLARQGKELGLLRSAGIDGAFDLRLLNRLKPTPSSGPPANGG